MNLRGIANGMTSRINPNITAIGRRYKGETIGTGRKPVPEYYPDEEVTVQLQPLSDGDLKHVDGMNLQGLVKTLFINGAYYGANRTLKKGGDLFIIDGQEWLVVDPVELWPDWSRVIICLQTT
ncbi:hypothetical protein [Morganella sp. GD04133]|uniref:hypothetical protein n=1 Tax=Morganella sp. GD04133 TaxID=2975435 RepID=UPI00244967D7|nr:hypothetical protein [Morganella sp. GD04133]MDH0356963.1 hypothetical protein [Morganella sp. GD04133]